MWCVLQPIPRPHFAHTGFRPLLPTTCVVVLSYWPSLDPNFGTLILDPDLSFSLLILIFGCLLWLWAVVCQGPFWLYSVQGCAAAYVTFTSPTRATRTLLLRAKLNKSVVFNVFPYKKTTAIHLKQSAAIQSPHPVCGKKTPSVQIGTHCIQLSSSRSAPSSSFLCGPDCCTTYTTLCARYDTSTALDPHMVWCGGCPVQWMSGVVDVLFYT